MSKPTIEDSPSAPQSVAVTGQRNIIVQASGSGISVAVKPSEPYLSLTLFENRTALLREDTHDTALLSAYRNDVVPLIGREADIADFQQWLDSKKFMSIRVLVGAGGRGKTRLAMALAQSANETGWISGFLTREEMDRFFSQQNLSRWAWDKPTLIIIDYAASRSSQLKVWLNELVDAYMVTHHRPPLRLLLIERQARSDFGWFSFVFGSGEDDSSRAVWTLLDPPQPLELSAIDQLDHRRAIFGTLLTRKQPNLAPPSPGEDAAFDTLLASHTWAGDPLFLMMAGLVASEMSVNDALSLSRADLAIRIARRELKRIGDLGAATEARSHDGHQIASALARHAAVLVTLLQGVSVAELRKIIIREKKLLQLDADTNAIVLAVREALPVYDTLGDTIAPILPDIIGEGAIVSWLGQAGYVVTVGEDVDRCIKQASADAPQRVSETLIRTAQDYGLAGYDKTVDWVKLLADESMGNLDALMSLANQLPKKTITLSGIAAALHEEISERLRRLIGSAVEQDEITLLRSQHAIALGNLADALHNIGRSYDAFQAASEEVSILRALSEMQPTRFEPSLAVALSNMTVRYDTLGQLDMALKTAFEAVLLHRSLVMSDPDKYSAALAASLTHLSNIQSAIGSHVDALSSATEAVDVQRSVIDSESEEMQSRLAVCLNNLSTRQSAVGEHRASLHTIEETIKIRRRLAANRRDSFLPELAASLSIYAHTLRHLGEKKKALEFATEASRIYRDLAIDRPEIFKPSVGNSLFAVVALSSELGQNSIALAAAEECVDIFRPLSKQQAMAFQGDLATALRNLVVVFNSTGRNEPALPLAIEAVSICRQLAQAHPDAFEPDLAEALNNLANCLRQMSRFGEAMTTAKEAIAVLKPHFLKIPKAHTVRMLTMCHVYNQACIAMDVSPDGELLDPIVEILLKNQPR